MKCWEKTFHLFTCILPKYVPHEITREFWKNIHFENMTAGFLLMFPNSLWCIFRNDIFYFTISAPLLFLLNVICVVSRCFLIPFWDHNISKWQLLLPWINISMANQEYFSRKWILTPQKDTIHHIFKLAIFSKFFGDFMRHIIG